MPRRSDRFPSRDPLLADLRRGGLPLAAPRSATLRRAAERPSRRDGVGRTTPTSPTRRSSIAASAATGQEIGTRTTNLAQEALLLKFCQTVNSQRPKVQVLTCKQSTLNHDGSRPRLLLHDKVAQRQLQSSTFTFYGNSTLPSTISTARRCRDEGAGQRTTTRSPTSQYKRTRRSCASERDTHN